MSKNIINNSQLNEFLENANINESLENPSLDLESFGGKWKINVSQDELANYKTSVSNTIANVSKMIVPAKAINLIDGQLYANDAPAGAKVSFLANADYVVNNEVLVKAGKYLVGTKSTVEYTLYLRPGDIVRVHATIDPDNVTNNQLKWTVAAESDFTVIGRVKEDNLDFCRIIALQNGEDSIIISAKTITKDYEALAVRIHVVVDDSFEHPYDTFGNLFDNEYVPEDEVTDEFLAEQLALKADKTELSEKANKNEVYTKAELDEHEGFFVNNVLTFPDANGCVTLQAQGTYTLKGYLAGHIVVDGSAITSLLTSEELDLIEPTTLILDDLFIESDSANAISYTGEKKTLKVVLAEDSENYIVATAEEALAANDPLKSTGLINSLQHVEIGGFGYLVLRNTYGNHGVKAEGELKVVGRPHIIVLNNNGHDGLHGSNGVTIDNGVFELVGCKDGIGTGNSGAITIYAGHYTFNDIAESKLDSKVSGVVYSSAFVSGIEASGSSGITIKNSNSYSSGHIYTIGNAGPEYITADGNGNYTVPTGDVYVEGLINGNIIAPNQETKLILSDASILGAISYTNSKKNIKISLAEDTVNYVNNIVSTNNIQIIGKGNLYCDDYVGYEHNVNNRIEGSTIIFKGDGRRYVAGCRYSAIIGTELVFGEEDGASILVPKDPTSTSKEAIYIDDAHARLNSDNTKKGTVVFYPTQKGYIHIGTLSYAELASYAANGIFVQTDASLLQYNHLDREVDKNHQPEVTTILERVDALESNKLDLGTSTDTIADISYHGLKNALVNKAEAANTYTKAEVDSRIGDLSVKEVEATNYDYIYNEETWDASVDHGALHLYYEAYPDEDLWNTTAHRAANFNDIVWTAEIYSDLAGETLVETVDYKATWGNPSQLLTNTQNANDKYYVNVAAAVDGNIYEMFTDSARTTTANKYLKFVAKSYPDCSHAWEGAVNAPGAKFPWIAPYFTLEDTEKALIKFEYEGKIDILPWGDNAFGVAAKANGANRLWGIASVAEEWKDKGFLITANASAFGGDWVGTEGANNFDITKFKMVLIKNYETSSIKAYVDNRVQSAKNAIPALPELPNNAANGTYVLRASKVNGTVTYTWVAE